MIARKLRIPIYISRLTAPAIAWDENWGDTSPHLELFQAGTSFTIGDIDVTSFTIPHDAVDPVGFSFRAEGIKISIATDLGYLPDSIRHHLRGSDLLLLESNHDVEMLKVGPYPWSVKQRVMGRNGHLSNDVACTFIRDDLDTSHLDPDPGPLKRKQQSSRNRPPVRAAGPPRPQPVYETGDRAPQAADGNVHVLKCRELPSSKLPQPRRKGCYIVCYAFRASCHLRRRSVDFQHRTRL